MAAVHESMPEVASAPANATSSAWLYHPFASGSRAGTADAVGTVASYLTVSDAVREFPALSLQAPLTAPAGLSGPL